MTTPVTHAAEVEPLEAVERARARGAAACDPVRFAVAEALARRAGAHEGDTRQRLLLRVDALLASISAASDTSTAVTHNAATALADLSALVDRLGRTAVASAAAPRSTLQPAAPEPLKAVARFRHTWSRLRADQRLRQALAQVPAMAGPLNSSHLVNRALQELRALSPAYLDAFMAHADTLLWLEQASGGDLPAAAARAPRKA